jgi:hypothetical protein
MKFKNGCADYIAQLFQVVEATGDVVKELVLNSADYHMLMEDLRTHAVFSDVGDITKLCGAAIVINDRVDYLVVNGTDDRSWVKVPAISTKVGVA